MNQFDDIQADNVCITSDYDKFKPLLEDMDPERASKVLESFRKYGYISCPIIVNEKFEIIDGRARLAACKSLELPVEYIVNVGASIDDCYRLNKDKGTWTNEDFKYLKPAGKRRRKPAIICMNCSERGKALALIEYQIEYWIRQKMQLERELEGKDTIITDDKVKEARREYQRRFYERHPEKRKEYQDRFYKKHAAAREDPETKKPPAQTDDTHI